MTTLFNGEGGGVGGGGRDPARARGTRLVRRGRRRTPPTGARKRSNGPPRRTRLALFFRVVVASVKGVLDVKVDASVVIAGGKKRYIYDYHATVEYEISDGGGEVVASGSLRLPEVHSANMSSGKRRRSWRWRYWLGSARRPPPPGTTISERASRRKKRQMLKDTFHGRQEEHFRIRGEVQRTKYLGPQWVLMLPQLHPHSHHRQSCH